MSEKYRVSQEFKEFMIALKAWIDSDFQQNVTRDSDGRLVRGFQKDDSICFQIENWDQSEERVSDVAADLEYLLEEEFGTSNYPFNEGNEFGDSDEYNDEVDNESHYSNKARVDWINKLVASFEEKSDE